MRILLPKHLMDSEFIRVTEIVQSPDSSDVPIAQISLQRLLRPSAKLVLWLEGIEGATIEKAEPFEVQGNAMWSMTSDIVYISYREYYLCADDEIIVLARLKFGF